MYFGTCNFPQVSDSFLDLWEAHRVRPCASSICGIKDLERSDTLVLWPSSSVSTVPPLPHPRILLFRCDYTAEDPGVTQICWKWRIRKVGVTQSLLNQVHLKIISKSARIYCHIKLPFLAHPVGSGQLSLSPYFLLTSSFKWHAVEGKASGNMWHFFGYSISIVPSKRHLISPPMYAAFEGYESRGLLPTMEGHEETRFYLSHLERWHVV